MRDAIHTSEPAAQPAAQTATHAGNRAAPLTTRWTAGRTRPPLVSFSWGAVTPRGSVR